ncbi:YdaS family helix-turn-helix protein [Acinetobacter baumannii]|uniref:YdaS family helix-turn-helix protein n=1 Tax=Acinetobacter calcoaceticus/baumannii complex TaxID=909768 RepID=UPI0024DE05F1|nr:YdaS family helix-turn-helix protein [Acinetobacter baumannii]MDK2146334.1 YdaS family helix-turn-helix protein [Acinetobacter baumannii]MDK2164846.1 YdaS family helix-turn-helix protein [Acinetobacter baumannii]MDK2175881.1 YdaS family helix-turn-helix protein [Acinetobacter baumannii]MDK2204918.1 YdaS family helix-turn-helix protein [Acinetobacter baumannii]MDK2211952.1 YdaS family helix-turn-helix protein [Acinetobacter baumannii]
MKSKLIALYEKLVDHLGGQTSTAVVLLVSQPSVNAWVKGKNLMSPIVAKRAERVTNGIFKAAELCPSLKEFDE